MTATECRFGLHRWKREWGVGGQYRVSRRCGTPATARKLAGHVTARALSIAIVVVAVLAGALVLAILADAVFDKGPQPDYDAARTASCLRADGSRIYA